MELQDVIYAAIDARLIDVNTALPGIVVSFNPADNTAVVQPAMRLEYADGSVVDLPQIFDVPVCFPRAGERSLTFTLEPGHYVSLHFEQRSIEQFMVSGGVKDPRDPRKHALSDAICYPGFYPKSQPADVPAAGLLLRSKLARLLLSDDGRFRIEATGGDELLTLIAQLAADVGVIGAQAQAIGVALNTIAGFTLLIPAVASNPTSVTAVTTAGSSASGAAAMAGTAGAAATTVQSKVIGITGV